MTSVAARVLRWDGCVNVRDLGGLPLRDGGETAFRVVVRADSLPGLTDGGRTAMLEYGVTTIVDLRSDRERGEKDGVGGLPVGVVPIPIDPKLAPEAWSWPSMDLAYAALIGGFRDEFARAVSTVGQAEPPAAVHCAGGRDRTGILCGLLLWLAGVDPEAIAADHALSDESWEPHNDAWYAEAADEAERDRRRRIAVPAGRTLADVLARLDREQGIRAYLEAGGVDEQALDRTVARLRRQA